MIPETAIWLLGIVGTYLVLFLVAELAVWRLQPPMATGITLSIPTEAGTTLERTVHGHKFEGRLYIASNHWFRKWYHAVLAHPEILVTRNGNTHAYSAVPVTGEERQRLQANYRMGALRIVTAFAPSRFLRLDPRG
ncbi:MAG: nitroreductase/quinone reductase family protein [Pseudomonadota bacterium]